MDNNIKRTRECIQSDDKKYSVLDNMAAKLMVSAHRTREKTGAKLLATSPSTAYDFMTKNEEGKKRQLSEPNNGGRNG